MKEITFKSEDFADTFTSQAFKNFLKEQRITCSNCRRAKKAFNFDELLCLNNVVADDHFCLDFKRKLIPNE